ncbi:MAG: hypothetical protein ACRCSP_03130 [Rhodoglobus sp.]
MTTRSQREMLPEAGHRSRPEEDVGRIAMDNDSDNVGGYSVPVDPMDLLQCDSCQ